MLLNYLLGEDSWGPLELQGDQISQEISPEYLLEGLMLKVTLQHFGYMTLRADLLEKSLMLGKIEGRRRRGQQDEIVGRHHQLDGHEWASSMSWWWTRYPGMLQSMGHKELDMTELNELSFLYSLVQARCRLKYLCRESWREKIVQNTFQQWIHLLNLEII